MENGMDRKKNFALRKNIIVFSVLIGIVLVVLHSALVNVKEIEKHTRQNLEDVARQNAAILEAKINAQYRLLLSLAEDLSEVAEEDIDRELGYFDVFIEEFQLKRFAFCFPDGMTYSTDGEPADLSYREFYRKGMEGKCDITGVLSDAIGEEHNPVNVMSTPVYDEQGTIRGIFGLTYDTEVFNRSLQIDSFEGKGHSCILNEAGEIMVAVGGGLSLSTNFLDEVLSADERNVQATEELRRLMAEKQDGSGTMYLTDKLYYYEVPVELMDGSVTWYILTMIPAELVNERIAPIQQNQYGTVLLVLLFVVIGVMLVMMYTRKQHRQTLCFAYEDPVTKGANYTKFRLDMERLENREGCLVAMDIANFNNISVVAGEASGNVMIREAWEIISSTLGREELAAHIRDDMFLIFLREQEEDRVLHRMEEISERIADRAKDFEVYGIQARCGIYRMSGEEPLERAYSRVKLAKEYADARTGLNYAFYSETNRVKRQHDRQLEDRFPAALENEEFKVWYQPKYSAGDCRVIGSEALVRWKTDSGEMISPGEFIPLFEHNGMIVKLDEYMFRAVCRQQKKWLDEGRRVYPVSVNISRASLYCLDIHKRYNSIMQEYQIDPAYIQLEVTETVMEERTSIRELLNKFRQMGIKILMDDFGTGYSSLATLSLQCFDTLKLDKTLIDHIGNKDGEIMLYHIIRMGQQIGLHITAEGVEKQEQLDFLQNMKCDDIQGFYFSRPVPMEQYEEMLVKSAN